MFGLNIRISKVTKIEERVPLKFIGMFASFWK